jgi:hypothetical protein
MLQNSVLFINLHIIQNTLKNKQKFSISLSKEVLDRLRIVAKRESMSVNNLINRTLENYSNWNLHNTEFIPIRKALLSKLLEKFTHEEMDSIATSMAHTNNKDTVLRFTNHFDVLNILKTCDEWLRLTGFPYSYEAEGSIHRFIVLHDLGSKWSLYMAKLLASTMNQFGIIPTYEYTDKILSFTVDLGQIESEKERTDKQIEILNSAIKEIESK